MKFVVFSLFGDDPRYTLGALANAQDAKKYYPGWTCVFYIDDLERSIACELKWRDAIVYPAIPDVGGLYWRHCFPDNRNLPIEYYVVRDCDSRMSDREKAAVDVWLESGRVLHIMRDHPKHTVPIMQGMYGVRGTFLRGITGKLNGIKNERSELNPVLRELYDSIEVHDKLEHGEFNMELFPNQLPFPMSRNDGHFVGEICGGDGLPIFDDRALL